MNETKDRIPIFRHRRLPTVHWKDSKAMHRVIHSFPNLFKSILLELMDGPMNRHEIRDFLNRIARADRRSSKLVKAQLRLEKDLSKAREMGVLEEKDGKYYLTPAGREIAEHMQLVIPAFMKWVFSPETVSLFSLGAHVVLGLLKLGIGPLSRSAGLFADGIDNTVDTISSLLVWLGIKYEKEKLVSVFILLTMFLSVGGVALATVDKSFHLEPVKEGLTAYSDPLLILQFRSFGWFQQGCIRPLQRPDPLFVFQIRTTFPTTNRPLHACRILLYRPLLWQIFEST